MQDPAALFRLETDTDLGDLSAETLVVALRGFVDAGRTQRLVVDHLKRTLDHTVVATFEVDELLDYRARRPRMTFARDHYEGYSDPLLALYRFVDDAGKPFFLLDGPEPDYQWERVVAAVMILIRALRVEQVLTVYGIPMAVPHTRPVTFGVHATTPELRQLGTRVFGTLEAPGSVAGLLEYRLGEEGRTAAGFIIHVPHYLAQGEYPAGASCGLQLLAQVAALDLSPTALEMAAADSALAIGAEVAQSAEATEIVRALEEQYDARIGNEDEPEDSEAFERLGEIDASSIPTGDQLGAEVEAFLDEIRRGRP